MGLSVLDGTRPDRAQLLSSPHRSRESAANLRGLAQLAKRDRSGSEEESQRLLTLHPASLETDSRLQRASLSSAASATPWAAASRGRGLLSPTLHSLRLAPTGLSYYPVPM